MNTDLLERLLHDSESTHLDFKSQQYAFYAPATDYQKSELLKDILAMANADTRDDRFILIGVEEVKGGRGIIHEVTSFLNDNDIQQFVNSKVQRPISFQCYTVECDGKQIQVIFIPVQERGLFLKSDLKDPKGDVLLRKNVIYYRLGSSTAEATPDDIARWAAEATAAKSHPELVLGFAAPTSEAGLWDSGPTPGDLGPDFGWSTTKYSKLLDGHNIRIFPELEFPQDMKLLEELKTLFIFVNCMAKVGFSVKNTSSVCCKDLRLIITIPRNKNTSCILGSKLTRPVVKIRKEMEASHTRVCSAEFKFKEYPSHYSIGWGIAKLFPGETKFSSDYVFFRDMSGSKVLFKIDAMAENLPRPITQVLTSEFRMQMKDDALPDFFQMMNSLKDFDARANYSIMR